MKIEPQILLLKEKKLVGMSKRMCFANNLTAALWRSFMPRRNDISHCVNDDRISMQIYPVVFDFAPNKEFEKWAAVEVSEYASIPQGLEATIIPEGLYAAFHYKGLSIDTGIFQYIFTEWLPKSKYKVDNIRPHFELLGKKYKNNAPDSEEDIFIPIEEK